MLASMSRRAILPALLLLTLGLTGCSSAAAPGEGPGATAGAEAAASPAAPEPIDPAVLLGASIPSICEHPAGALVDGSLPGIAENQGEAALFGYAPGTGIVEGEDPLPGVLYARGERAVPGDTGREALIAAVLACSKGGVAWPQSVAVWDAEGALLGGLTLSEITGGPREAVSEILAEDDGFRVRWRAHGTGDPGCCGTEWAEAVVSAPREDSGILEAAGVTVLDGTRFIAETIAEVARSREIRVGTADVGPIAGPGAGGDASRAVAILNTLMDAGRIDADTVQPWCAGQLDPVPGLPGDGRSALSCVITAADGVPQSVIFGITPAEWGAYTLDSLYGVEAAFSAPAPR